MLIFKKKKTLLLQAAIFVFITFGCTEIKYLPATQLTAMHERREIARVHFGDSLWVLSKYEIKDNTLKGEISMVSQEIKSKKAIDYYVAPSSAIKVDGNILSVPFENIGKIDYLGHTLVLDILTGSIILLYILVPALLW